jgi:hypothetical protein
LQFSDGNFVESEVGDELAAAKNHATDKGVGSGDEGNEAAPEEDFVVAIVHVLFGVLRRNTPARRPSVNGNFTKLIGSKTTHVQKNRAKQPGDG